MNRKKKECKDCKQIVYLYSHGRCKYCAGRVYNKKIKAKINTNIQADKSFYMQVWNNRQHVCEECNQPLYEPHTYNFHHIQAKSKYPELRHTESNIALLCLQCHSQEHVNPGTQKKPPPENRQRTCFNASSQRMTTI